MSIQEGAEEQISKALERIASPGPSSLKECSELEWEICHLYKTRPAAIFYIKGRRGTGKTDFSLLKMEILDKWGIIKNFATNIKIYNSSFPIVYIGNLQDLDFWAQNTPGRKLFSLDEAGKIIRRRTPMSKVNIDFLDDFQTLRKFKLSADIIAPADRYIDSAATGSDVLDVVFDKPIFNNPKVGVWIDQQESFSQTFTQIDRTSIKFDTYDPATFSRYAPKKIPLFKDQDKKILWEWSHGANSESLGVARSKIHTLSVKFIKEALERESIT